MFRWVAVAVLVLGLVGVQTADAQIGENLEDQMSKVSRPFSIVGKPAFQRTTYSSQYPAKNAVDGSSSSNIAFCSHTAGDDLSPWWGVRLEADHCVSKVRILNRGDCCSERLTGAVVRAGESSYTKTNPTCGSPVTAAKAEPRGGTIEFDCSPGLRARYLSVHIPGTATLQLCEVSVEEFPLDQCPQSSTWFNIVGKPAVQNSDYHTGTYPASKAVDGSMSSKIAHCSHTAGSNDWNPWWRVDLRDDHCISKVRILNRGDCCSERLTGAVVRAGASSNPTRNPTCGSPVTAAQAKPRGGTIEFNCSPALRARYISVDIPDVATLQLCEVNVEEFPLDQCVETDTGTATGNAFDIVGKPAQQSSTYSPGYSADKAVDGSQSAILYPLGVCSHTHAEQNPWWKVDLGGEQCVTKVTILNRGDCCSERLANAVVRVGSVGDPVLKNQECGLPITAEQAQPLGGTIEIECGRPLSGRYVSVDIPGSATLQLCEVSVEVLSSKQC